MSANSNPVSTWSHYPATYDVNLNCNIIQDVSSTSFCDGTYIGPGDSFDISANQVLVLSGKEDIAGSYDSAAIVATDRIRQILDPGPSWNAMSGYYGLAKDAAPALSIATAEKAITSWSAATIAVSPTTYGYYTSVCYSPELRRFISVGGLTSNTGLRVVYSDDGINWSPVTIDSTLNNGWKTVIWCPQKRIFVAVGFGSAASWYLPKVMTSPDGLTWSGYNSPDNTASWEGLTYSPELDLFVAVASATNVARSGFGSEYRIMTSTNGQSWTLRAAPAANSWNTVIWVKELGLFIACSSDGGTQQIMTSPDGINWTLRNTPSPQRTFRELAYSPQLGMIIACNQSNGEIIGSNDGITWTLQTTPLSSTSYAAIAACWAHSLNMFLTIHTIGPATGRADIMWSSDGINWKSSTIFNNVDMRVRHVIYSDELGIFVGVSSTTGLPHIIYSSLSGSSPTSYNVFDSSFNQIDQSGNWTFRRNINVNSLARGVPVTKTTSSFTVGVTENWIICNRPTGTITVTLPSASAFPRREIMFKNLANQLVISNTTNIIQLGSIVLPTNSILPAGAGATVTLVSDGVSNWIAMQ